MEFLNKVELRGIVGRANTMKVGDSTITRFSVATEYGYKDNGGTPVIETQWHNVCAWNAPEVKKGDAVEVTGRIKVQKYTGADGIDHTVPEIYANTVKVIDGKITAPEGSGGMYKD